MKSVPTRFYLSPYCHVKYSHASGRFASKEELKLIETLGRTGNLLKLLFVDDMRDTRDFFRFAFELEDVEVRLASNGQEAVDLVRREPFDAIIMDVEMPEMNGWDAVRHIRTLPYGDHIPILMYTANGDSETRRKATEVGANTVLFKPLLPREILSRIEKLRV